MSSEAVSKVKTGTEVMVNHRYKDTVFRMIFKEKSALLSLYNALNGTNYQNPDELEVNTMENAIYLGKKNDISFVIDSRLNLYEHQSTFNPNMPMRDLFYVSALYSKLTMGMDLYSRRSIEVPFPQFIVFYNGTEEQPEKKLLKLSDLYSETGRNYLKEAYASDQLFSRLELDVLMLNINKGYNQELKDGCRLLSEYMMYVDKVRGYAEWYPLEIAVEKAVDECIREGILEKFLRENRAEVISMSIFEYNEAEHLRMIARDEHAAGKIEGKIEDILEVLNELGSVSEELILRIRQEKDLNRLKKILKLAIVAESIVAFEKQVHIM
ncbi:MAG: hypothetical protein IJN46_04865 [Lachnospiraceae bacterium]|nr:hypothetical protein [Lachnospiraceae bacterium]